LTARAHFMWGRSRQDPEVRRKRRAERKAQERDEAARRAELAATRWQTDEGVITGEDPWFVSASDHEVREALLTPIGGRWCGVTRLADGGAR
jgi:hypothetical protein